MKNKTIWLMSVVCLLSVLMLVKGCNQNEPPTTTAIPPGSQPQRVVLRTGSAPTNPTAKATHLRIDAICSVCYNYVCSWCIYHHVEQPVRGSGDDRDH